MAKKSYSCNGGAPFGQDEQLAAHRDEVVLVLAERFDDGFDLLLADVLAQASGQAAPTRPTIHLAGSPALARAKPGGASILAGRTTPLSPGPPRPLRLLVAVPDVTLRAFGAVNVFAIFCYLPPAACSWHAQISCR